MPCVSASQHQLVTHTRAWKGKQAGRLRKKKGDTATAEPSVRRCLSASASDSRTRQRDHGERERDAASRGVHGAIEIGACGTRARQCCELRRELDYSLFIIYLSIAFLAENTTDGGKREQYITRYVTLCGDVT